VVELKNLQASVLLGSKLLGGKGPNGPFSVVRMRFRLDQQREGKERAQALQNQ
jgi:hypothetical protein